MTLRYPGAIALSCLMLALALAPSASAQTEASAEEAAAADEGLICLTIAHRWNGSAEERAQIEAVPVPESFRSMYNAGGCARFSLMLESLVTWHIRYGTGQLALAAGQFFERDMQARVPSGFLRGFEHAWRDSMREAQAAFDAEQASSPDKSDEDILRAIYPQLSAISRSSDLDGYRSKLDTLRFVAGEYTRAAEAFHSRDLLCAARRVHEPVFAAEAFLDEEAAGGVLEHRMTELVRAGFFNGRMDAKSRALTLAVVEAEIERDAAAIRAADAITQRLYRPDGKDYPFPDLLTFALTAYEEDGEACLADERNSLPGYVDRCRANAFENVALGFWYNRSRLELLARELAIPLEALDRQSSMDGATPRTVDLFVRRAWHQGMRYGEYPPPPEAVRLLIRSAEAAIAPNASNCEARSREWNNAMNGALDTLIHAEQLASPVEQPWLYREVADAMVRTYEQFMACDPTVNEERFRRAWLVSKAFLETYPVLDRPGEAE